ncbi:YceI family protein [uncultured Aquimarina sp.]|uniref:YceI family protein n=1 Tax=uncultured Aquimarina sp. TaxID=575652 RepID=UPI00263838C2|nr:YceI family protein [uncultured Aquimarina sp.]
MKDNQKNQRNQNNKANTNSIKMYLGVIIVIFIFSCSKKTDFITTESGLQYKIVKPGAGMAVVKGQEVLIHETTKYTNDFIVYTSRDRPEPLKILVGGNQVIKGVDEGLLGMQKGEIRKLIVPPSLSKRMGNMTFPHPDSTLLYDIELIDIVEKKTIAEVKKGDALKIDKEKSILKWEGFNKLQSNGHYGKVSFHSGEFYKDEGKLIGGDFVIDMNTIINTDGEYSQSLIDHLKNEDFFETNTYPTASLKITSIKYTDDSNISLVANLTIKDVQQPIEFDAHITYNDEKLVFASKFIIDRTRWNMFYRSGSIFDGLGDNLISDEIHFEVTIITE